MYASPYVPPTVTVDGVLFQIIDGELAVLLIQRTTEPFAGEWALPGGYCAAGETTHQALNRALGIKAGLSTEQLPVIEQLYTFDSVARDPRGHAVSVAYMGLGRDVTPAANATQNPQFFTIASLPELAYDHREIIAYAHDRLKSKLSYTNIAFALLPERFTLSQLQSTYEATLDTPLDKRNFRKKVVALGIITETSETIRDGAHRPARLFAFTESHLQTIVRDFNK